MIAVFNHIEELFQLSDDAFFDTLSRLSDQLGGDEPYPFKFFVQASIRNVVQPLLSDASRDERLKMLLGWNLTPVARESAQHVSTVLPAPIDTIEVHIFPAWDRGGGCTIAPGKVFISVKIDELAPIRLQRNIAHEYSHSVRMTQKPQASEHGYGIAVPYTVRDYLIFEGLAGVTAEVSYPAPLPPPCLAEADEAAWWNAANLDAVGPAAYRDYIGDRASEIGQRIVRAYLQNHGTTVVQAHNLTDHELYWNSGYPCIR